MNKPLIKTRCANQTSHHMMNLGRKDLSCSAPEAPVHKRLDPSLWAWGEATIAHGEFIVRAARFMADSKLGERIGDRKQKQTKRASPFLLPSLPPFLPPSLPPIVLTQSFSVWSGSLGTHSVDQTGPELRFACLCLPSDKVKGVCHQFQPVALLMKVVEPLDINIRAIFISFSGNYLYSLFSLLT